jgi:hypothetical protein
MREMSLMGTVVVKNVGTAMFRGRMPRTVSGERCRFAARLTGKHTARFSTTLPEALSVVMGELYAQQDQGERRTAREVFATALAVKLQAAFLIGQEVSDVDSALLLSDKGAPVNVETYAGEVPLMLVESQFAPFTEVPAPNGRVMWVRPVDEWLFAVSLAEAGVVDVEVVA